MDVVRIPDLAAGLAALGLGMWVVALDWRKRLHQSFALLMLAVGTHFLGLGFSEQSQDAGSFAMVIGLLVTPFAALDFAVAFQHAHRPTAATAQRGPRRGARGLLAVGAAATVASFLIHPDLFYGANGPLGLADQARSLVLAGLAAVVGLQALKAHGARRDALLLFCAGFALHPAFFATWRLGVIFPLDAPVGAFTLAGAILNCLSVVAMLSLCIALVVASRHADGRTRRATTAILIAIALAMATAVAVQPLPEGLFIPYSIALGAAWEFAFAAVASYAVLRYCLFSLDPRFARIVREGGTAAIIGFAFFVAENTLQNALQGSLPVGSRDFVPALGAGAVAALALWPVHRAFSVLARRVGGAVGAASRRGMDIYRAAYMAATQDGIITVQERHALERLAAALQLGRTDVQAVEEPAGRRPLTVTMQA